MTLLSAIFFSVRMCGVPIACLLFSPILHAGEVEGKINVKRADRSGIVVWLEPVSGTAFALPRRARILQKDKKFQPHVLVVTTGSAVEFPNADPIFHSAFSNFNGQIFDIGLYPPGTTRTVIFRNPGVVHVFCNIHPSMAAVIVVINSPFYSISNALGKYSIPNVLPGEYRLRVFSERSTPSVLDSVMRNVVVSDMAVTLPPIELSESGSILTRHNNKYGRPYPPVSEDSSGYTIPQ